MAVPDVAIECAPASCRCRETRWLTHQSVKETRQVFELPAPQLKVIEYRRIERWIPGGERQ